MVYAKIEKNIKINSLKIRVQFIEIFMHFFSQLWYLSSLNSLSIFPFWCTIRNKVVVTFYLRLRNEFQQFLVKKPGPELVDLLSQPIRGLIFCGKWMKFISQSQIKVTTTLVLSIRSIIFRGLGKNSMYCNNSSFRTLGYRS